MTEQTVEAAEDIPDVWVTVSGHRCSNGCLLTVEDFGPDQRI